MATQQPRSASRYRRLSLAIARRGAREARKALATSSTAAASTITAHQLAQAALAQQATSRMVSDQGIRAAAKALLNLAGFTTEPARLVELVEQTATDEFRFNRAVESSLQDVARAAQEVATAALEPERAATELGWVRHLTLPSCSRCAVLAGRVYRYSEGFLRHPNCDCVMVPTTVGRTDVAYDLEGLVRDGQVAGLSKADRQALAEGADFNQVVNIRSRAAGLSESGRVLARAGRPTPEGIFRLSSDRAEVLNLLTRFGYLR